MQSVRESHALLALLHLLSLHVFIFFLLFLFLFPVTFPICLPLPCDSAMCSCHTPQPPLLSPLPVAFHVCCAASLSATCVSTRILFTLLPPSFYSTRVAPTAHPIPSIPSSLRPLHHSHPSALRGPHYACSHTCMRHVSLPLFFIIVHVFCVLF